MNAQKIEQIRIRAHCAFKGHRKTWAKGFLGPTWECERCGRQGDLADHSALSLGEHLMHLAIAVVALAIIWWLLKLIF